MWSINLDYLEWLWNDKLSEGWYPLEGAEVKFNWKRLKYMYWAKMYHPKKSKL